MADSSDIQLFCYIGNCFAISYVTKKLSKKQKAGNRTGLGRVFTLILGIKYAIMGKIEKNGYELYRIVSEEE